MSSRLLLGAQVAVYTVVEAVDGAWIIRGAVAPAES